MNDSFDDGLGQGGSYMSLGIQEKSELIFKDIKNSYVFWSIKKAIKDEVVKGGKNSKGGLQADITEAIPKLLGDLNLETKIKNKVHEILDRNGYFKDQAQIAVTKFKNCTDLGQLPQYFFDKDYEPLEAVATAKRAWSEQLKQKLNSILRLSRKPFVRPKKEKVVVPKPKEVPEPVQNNADTDNDQPIPLEMVIKKPKEEPPKDCAFLGGELPFVFDANTLMEAILKINTINFAGNLMLSWGQIKLQL